MNTDNQQIEHQFKPREWPAELTPEQAREFMQEKIARLLAQAPKDLYAETNL